MNKVSFVHTDAAYAMFVWGWWVCFKTPMARKYFSERNGYQKPLLEISGYRFFIERCK